MFTPKLQSTPTTLIKLKNGAEVSEAALLSTMKALESFEKNVLALYELLEKCRNPEHKMFGNTKKLAEDAGLLIGDKIHQDTKNIILSAVESHGSLKFSVSMPIEEKSTPSNKK
ncbi:MAG: hypothetical protein ABI597_13945 [Gammaproteobacteria bacterium]